MSKPDFMGRKCGGGWCFCMSGFAPRCAASGPPAAPNTPEAQLTLDGGSVASSATERDTRPVTQLDLETYDRDRRALADWTGELPPDISDDRP